MSPPSESEAPAAMMYNAVVVLLPEYCCDEAGHLSGPPHLWPFSVVSYSLFFGLTLPQYDKRLAEILRAGVGAARGTAELAIGSLTQVSRMPHASLEELWTHAVNTLCALASLTSPETSGPGAGEELVKGRMGFVGLTPGLLLALEHQELALQFAGAAVVERRRCPPQEFVERVTFMKSILGEISERMRER